MSLLGRKPLGTVAYLGGLPAVLEQFTWAYSQMIQFNCEYLETPKDYVHYTRTTYSLHHAARNDLAARFLGDWLLQLDTDHAFEPDLLMRMLRLVAEVEQDLQIPVDVLTGTYQYKGPPYSPVMFRWHDFGDGKLLPQPIACVSKEAKIIEIGSAGGGCLLVKRSVFDRIANARIGMPFDLVHGFGEDHSFFYRCHQLGIKCYAATHIQSPHLTLRAITLDDMDTTNLSDPVPVAGAA